MNEKPLSLNTRTSSMLPNSENVSRITWSVRKTDITYVSAHHQTHAIAIVILSNHHPSVTLVIPA